MYSVERYDSCLWKWVNYLKLFFFFFFRTMSLSSVLSADAIDSALKDCQGRIHRLSCLSMFVSHPHIRNWTCICIQSGGFCLTSFTSSNVFDLSSSPILRLLTINASVGFRVGYSVGVFFPAPDSFTPKKFFQLCGLTKKSPQEVKNVFNILDNDASGFIEEEELKYMSFTCI